MRTSDPRLSIFGSSSFVKASTSFLQGKKPGSDVPKLFDVQFYRNRYAPELSDRSQAWTHFCQVGFRNGFNPHPLFETTFYCDRYLQGQPDANPLLHYIENCNQTFDTHPLLNVQFYLSQLDRKAIALRHRKQTWLEYFLENNLKDLKSPSSEFSSRQYVEQHPDIVRSGINPLYHFVSKLDSNCHTDAADVSKAYALFDEAYYLESNRDIAEAGMDPWKHFCEHGFKENRNPHPLFDTRFYRDCYLADDAETNPVAHYMASGNELFNTHPLFDAAFYYSQINLDNDQIQQFEATPLQHFLKYNRQNLASPSPLFSTRDYLKQYPDIAECDLVPLYHFLRHGMQGKRQISIDRSHLEKLKFVSEQSIAFARQCRVPHLEFANAMAGMSNNPAVICVSHQGSLTGAPLIILKIAQCLRDKHGVEVINIVFRPGPLNERFELLGPTMNLEGRNLEIQEQQFSDDMDFLSNILEGKDIVGAIVNSAESRDMLPTLKKIGIPSVSLVHENARCYADGKFDKIAALSDRTIFPSQYVRTAALEKASFYDRSTEILPQGLLHEHLLELEPEDPMNDIRSKFGIPEDATLVLSCGTLDGRKGIDLFLSTAIIAISEAKPGSMYFAWLGGNGFRQPLDQRYWMDKDLEVSGASKYVKLLGATDDVAPYLQACDMLYLPSRIDPFPCVVNEAMAMAKPVILFEGGSGCVSMIGDAGGAVVPYGNVAQAALAVHELSKYPLLRKEMGLRNREYVSKHLNFDQYVSKVFDSLLSAVDLTGRKIPESIGSSLLSNNRNRDEKKVIFCLPAWRISGVNTFVENLIRELRKAGIDASILFTTRDPSRMDQAEEMPDVPYRFLTAKSMNVEERQVRLKQYLEQNAPCVFVPNYDYTMSAITPDLPVDVGVLGVLHSDEDEHYLHGYQMGHYWDSIVAVSETIRERLLGLNPAFADRTQTIRYGIPVTEKMPAKRRVEDRVRLIYTGRIVQAQKRIFDFIDLLQKLEQLRLPFEFTFLGGGGDEVAFQKRLQPWVEKGVARYLGSCSSDVVAKELKTHDALVLMSEYEGLPLSLLEAMSQACVPVVTAIPSGISEILTHGKNGMLSPLGDIDGMAENIQQLHRDRILLDRISEQSWKTLEEHGLTVTHMASRYLEVLEGIFEKISRDNNPNIIPLHSHFVRKSLRVA